MLKLNMWGDRPEAHVANHVICRVMLRGLGIIKALAIMSGTLVLTALVPATAMAQRAPAPALPTSLVFDSVIIVDVEHGKLVPNQRVVIVGNRIQTIGEVNAVEIPSGAKVVNASGKYLIPGLWDMHVHTTSYLSYPLLLANGVTGFRDCWAYVPIDTMVQWRREILAGTRIGSPRQILSGVALDSPEKCRRRPNNWTGHICISSSDSTDLPKVVDALQAHGVDMLKTYWLTKKMYFAVAREARRRGIPFGGHAHEENAIDASDSGALILDHINTAGGVDAFCMNMAPGSGTPAKCSPVAEHLRRNGTWVTTTVTFILRSALETELWPDGDTKTINLRFHNFTSDLWDNFRGSLFHGNWLRDSSDQSHVTGTSFFPSSIKPGEPGNIMGIIESSGLPILVGTDAGVESYWSDTPGFALHAELATDVAEGLSPLTALQSATLNPAKALHATDSLGTVAPGKLADLVLLDASPLEEITNTTTIRAVVANGHYYDRLTLDRMIARAYLQAKRGVISWNDNGQYTVHIGESMTR